VCVGCLQLTGYNLTDQLVGCQRTRNEAVESRCADDLDEPDDAIVSQPPQDFTLSRHVNV
jgi:hypothetical protein